MTKRFFGAALVAVCVLAAGCIGGAAQARPGAQPKDAQLPVFTYQGYLEDQGQPADGAYDFSFSLWDAAEGGMQIGTSVIEDDYPVVKGVFTVELPVPAGAFAGDQRWLQVTIEGTTLPRQPVNLAPVAQYALEGPQVAESDPVYAASAASGISSSQVSQWDQAYAWGDHAGANYLTAESDPAFNASPAGAIGSGQINEWNQAYAWGNHASAGYLTSETDPSFTASPAAGITPSDIGNWNAAAAQGPQPWTISGNTLSYEGGNVGVGTPTPQGVLDVYSVGATGVDTQFTNRAILSICGATYCYQSFKVNSTGFLTRLHVLVCNQSGDAGTLLLFAGDCASNQSCDGSSNLLQVSQPGTAGCNINSGWGVYDFDPPVPVLAGHSYTFRTHDVTAYENNNGGYADGAAYEDLNPHLPGDVPFQAFVQPTYQIVLSDFVYFGSPGSEGTFRMGMLNGNLVMQRRVAGSWTTVQTW